MVELAVENVDLVLGRGVAEVHAHAEAIELRLGQGIGTVELDRVLGRDHQEGGGEQVGRPFDRDLAFAHRLEQARLGARRGAIDLVGEEDVGEDRSRLEGEGAVPGAVDRGADDVGGKQVRGELHPLEVGGQGLGEGLGQGGLAHSGYVLHQDVAAREQAHRDAFDGLGLAEDDAPELGFERVEPFHVRLIQCRLPCGLLDPKDAPDYSPLAEGRGPLTARAAAGSGNGGCPGPTRGRPHESPPPADRGRARTRCRGPTGPRGR